MSYSRETLAWRMVALCPKKNFSKKGREELLSVIFLTKVKEDDTTVSFVEAGGGE